MDAALDSVNVQKVANYIRERSKEIRFVVISLKDLFYEKSDALVGIYKDQKEASSRTLTLDLKQYKEN